jgi:hypothetical protein
MTGEDWARYKAVKDEKGESVLKNSADVAPTNTVGPVPNSDIIPPNMWTPAMRSYATLVETVAPKLIGKPVAVRFIDDEDARLEGCFSKGYRGNKSRKSFTRGGGMTVKQLKKKCRHYGEGAGCRKIFLAFRQGEVFFT